MKTKHEQAASAVLMVQPSSFGFDEQTAKTNTFQHHVPFGNVEALKRANSEFDAAVAKLRVKGIEVLVFEDPDRRPKPNAVFPNNWITTWPDGRVFLYPMATESRRIEKSVRVLEALNTKFSVQGIVDLSETEREGHYLESTGVMVFDHIRKVVYGCISPRCDETLFVQHAHDLGYRPEAFHAYDISGTAVYHSNVMMGVQQTTAVICAEAITDGQERDHVLQVLKETGHNVVQISQSQMASFCGNLLEVQNERGEHFLVMSQTAHDAFTEEQRAILSADKEIIPLAIPTIETIGGGSARCMLAEIFLLNRMPRKHASIADSLVLEATD